MSDAIRTQDCPGSSPWHVVLLVDSNERSHPRAKYLPRDELVRRINDAFFGGPIHCETKRLLAGDYMWIARKEGAEDQVLDCIIERKSLNDLVLSVTTTSNTYAPLNRMQVQMKKLESTTLDNKIFLLEKSNTGACAQFTKRGAFCKATKFATSVKQGDYPGFWYKQTSCINDTLRFLVDKHELMRNKVKQAYSQALAQKEKGVSVDEQMLKRSPFAPIGTIANINKSICKGLTDATFQYYLELRRIPNMGDPKTRVVMERFPAKHDLQECMDSDNAIKILASLELVGKSMARNVWDKFARKKPPPMTPTRGQTNSKFAAAQVTPGTEKTVQKRKRADTDGSFSADFHKTKRRLFGTDTVLDSKFARAGSCSSASADQTPLSAERQEGQFGEDNSHIHSVYDYYYDSISSDDDSLFEPIFPKTRADDNPLAIIRGQALASSEPNNTLYAPGRVPEITNVDDDEETICPEKIPADAEVITID
eukprot:scaffold1033_cov171-Amphora_coffeaeformis.AAC.20